MQKKTPKIQLSINKTNLKLLNIDKLSNDVKFNFIY